MKHICNIISKWMALIVLLTAAGALLWPAVFGVIDTSWISYLLGMVMFGMGLTININDFKIVFSRPRDIIIGCIAQFTIMPSLAWCLAKLFNLPPELAIGVILVGCCPGGTSSNVITYLAGGDLPLSVGFTSISTLLAPLLTPLLTWMLAGTYVNVSIWSMFISIISVVILPIFLGFIVKYYFRDLSIKIADYLPAFSTIAITLIVAAVVSSNSSSLRTSGMLIILVVVCHNILGYATGFLLGKILKLAYPKRIAICVEVGMQNSGLACSLANQHFSAMAMAAVPGAIFSVWHNISGALLARILRKY
ncbi:MAG: bile acid:sodium symporter family protein [Bacteroidaceae bacterium]|nr:bile acid:sodium symporter family protein [Bacteroidaceae bacterium]